jgi:RimJ/RimL family protein N-acetyltransferase
MRLVNVYREPTAENVLYALLQQRPPESRVSHRSMPSHAEHKRFVRSHPYRMWFLIRVDGEFVGDLHATENNEIGVFLFKQYRGKGYGSAAVRLFMGRHKPLGAIPAVRVRAWLAHIAPQNDAAFFFFRRLGFKKVQETMMRHMISRRLKRGKGIDGGTHV